MQSETGISLYYEEIVKAQETGTAWPHEPIQIVDVDGYKVVINGHHRIEAAKRANYRGNVTYEEVPIENTPYTLEEYRGFIEEYYGDN